MSAAPIESDPPPRRRFGLAPDAAARSDDTDPAALEEADGGEEPRRSRWARLAALRHHKAVRRSGFVALEVVASLLALVLSLLCMTWWWLSQGPAEVPVLRTQVESQLSAARDGRPVDIDRVELSWTARRGLQLLAADVAFLDARGREVSRTDEVSIGISPWHLLLGQIRLTRADFAGGDISIVRARDGAVNIAFGPIGAQPDIVLPPPPPNETLQARVIRILDGFSRALRPVGPGGAMRAISITDANLTILDESGGGRWTARGADFNMARRGGALSFYARAP